MAQNQWPCWFQGLSITLICPLIQYQYHLNKTFFSMIKSPVPMTLLNPAPPPPDTDLSTDILASSLLKTWQPSILWNIQRQPLPRSSQLTSLSLFGQHNSKANMHHSAQLFYSSLAPVDGPSFHSHSPLAECKAPESETCWTLTTYTVLLYLQWSMAQHLIHISHWEKSTETPDSSHDCFPVLHCHQRPQSYIFLHTW